MENLRVPATVYAESNPNPATMKFVTDKMLVPGGGSVEILNIQQAKNAPLAAALFNFPFVRSVFFSANYVTITKTDAVNWEDITTSLREFLRDYLTAGKETVLETVHSHPQTKTLNSSTTPNSELRTTNLLGHVEPATESEKKIVGVLDEYIRPAVEQDGGVINFKSFENGVVNLILRGACSGCPSSQITLKAGVEALLKRMVPEVLEVKAVEA